MLQKNLFFDIFGHTIVYLKAFVSMVGDTNPSPNILEQ